LEHTPIVLGASRVVIGNVGFRGPSTITVLFDASEYNDDPLAED
jgi:hypothetical protein